MRLLLAEDEKELSRALETMLKAVGYEVDAVYDGQEAVLKAKSGLYDCMILDIMMPKLDGVSALKEMRDRGDNTPALFLTAKSELDDKITGLEAGADDYLTKPFAMKELLARVKSLTRRAEKYTPKSIKVGSVTLDTEEQEISSENSIRLAKKEAKMMEMLMLNSDKDISTSDLYNHVWKGEEGTDESVVWIYISYLRSKLKAIDADVAIIGEEGQSFKLIQLP
ncbi:MAG: response regulator transcription factor [Lachnospiraceae bacterium]|nr:response regulator transcription factor [Lachnospiraceae bacterium]